MKIFRSSVVAALILMAGAVSAQAQQDQRFFGRWEPASKTAGGWPLIVEPGRMYFFDESGKILLDQRFEVIRDLGDHVLVKSWYVKHFVEGAGTEPNLDFLTIRDRPGEIVLDISDCGNPRLMKFLFTSERPDDVWGRVLALSDKVSGLPNDLKDLTGRCLYDAAAKGFRPQTSDGGARFNRKQQGSR